MLYAIISDINGNIEALEAVMNDIEFYQPDKIICLGDVIGYGPNPEECVKIVLAKCDFCLMGNHEAVMNNYLDVSCFTKFAKEASLWTKNKVGNKLKGWIETLKYVNIYNNITFSHGSLVDLMEFLYVQTILEVKENFSLMKNNLMFMGHSHQPLILFEKDEAKYSLAKEFDLDVNVKTIVNVGSVGQPRDENNKACYVIYDDIGQKIFFNRVTYDYEKTMNKIIDSGLPKSIAMRLEQGK